ncbi:MAG: hypothetical protein AAF500_01205 [Myxococcota bacterium]
MLASAERTTHGGWRLIAALGFGLAMLGCGDSTPSGTGGSGGGATGGSGGVGASGGTGASDGGGGAGGTLSQSGGAALCSLTGFGLPGGPTGFVRVLSEAEIEAGGDIDATDNGIEVGGGVSCAVWRNSVYAASFQSPTITRYDLIEGELVEGDTVSFMNFGVVSLAGLSSQIQVFSDTKAYFFDPQFAQIVVWNPTTMTTVEAIQLTGFDAPPGTVLSRVRAGRIDDRLVLWSTYVDDQGFSAPTSVFAFVDPETDEFVTDTVDTCGGLISEFVTTTNGDTYIGSSAADAINHALGFEGTFPPCIVRLRAGATEVDATFLGDPNALTGIGPTGGPLAGSGDAGFLVAYDESTMPLDPLRTGTEHTALENWLVYQVELGSTTPGTRVEALPAGQGVGGTTSFDGRGFLTRTARDFSGTTFFDLSQTPVEETYRFNAAVALFARLGAE